MLETLAESTGMNRSKLFSVTYLEMVSARQLRPGRPVDQRFSVKEATTPQWRFNRFLYEAVGSDWNWTDKLAWTAEQWAAYVEHPGLRTLVAYHDGSPAGYSELRFADGDAEIVYLGLLPAFIGLGFGGVLLTRVLEFAWSADPAPGRVWLHTCSQDHPGAVANYVARGMEIYRVDR